MESGVLKTQPGNAANAADVPAPGGEPRLPRAVPSHAQAAAEVPRYRSWFDPARWVQPQTLSVFAPLAVDAAGARALRAELEVAAQPLALTGLDELHYLRMFVIEPMKDLRGRELPPRLVLSAVFDGTSEAFLDRWIACAGPTLRALFGLCVEFPRGCSDVELRAWIMIHAERPQTFYIGMVRHRLAGIRAEARLRDAIENFVDREQTSDRWAHGDPRKIHAAIREFVRSCPDLPQAPRDKPGLWVHLLQALDLLRIVAIVVAIPGALAWMLVPAARASLFMWAIATVLTAVVIVVGYFLLIRLYELRERDPALPLTGDSIARLVAKEDHFPQNQFTMLSLVRDSWFRRLNLRFTLWASNTLSRHLWNRGRLVGIGTIHFARIHQLDEGRRFLFMSDFDGSWERYLLDFLEVGSFAVVPNWTNLYGCPASRFALWPPPGFAAGFLPFTRANQLATDLWYSAMPHLTVSEIERNAKIRAGLFRDPTEREAREWLQLL